MTQRDKLALIYYLGQFYEEYELTPDLIKDECKVWLERVALNQEINTELGREIKKAYQYADKLSPAFNVPVPYVKFGLLFCLLKLCGFGALILCAQCGVVPWWVFGTVVISLASALVWYACTKKKHRCECAACAFLQT